MAALAPSPPELAAAAQTHLAHPVAVQAGSGWRLSFTQGILIGQASMVILAVLFLKYVVFEDPEAAKAEAEERRAKRRKGAASGSGQQDGKTKRGRKSKAPLATDTPPSSSTAAALLSSLSYDLSVHPSESLDWLNILLAQLISSYRSLADTHAAGGAAALVEEALNKKTGGGEGEQGMVGLDYVEVDEVDLGEAFPSLSAARVRPSGSGGEGLRVELDLDYSDHVTLAVSTRVAVNFPRPRFAVLPVSLGVTLERFSGTLTIELPPPLPSTSSAPSSSSASHPPSHPHPTVHLSLHPDFDLQLRTSSLLGSRAKLQDVPKIEQLLAARIRATIQDRVVWPGRVEVALPGLAKHHHQPHKEEEPPFTPPTATSDLPLPRPPAPPAAAGLQPPLFPRSSSAFSLFSSATPSTPSVDLSAPEGPSLTLHPHIHPAAPPSPTESLPGYFPAASGRRASQQRGVAGGVGGKAAAGLGGGFGLATAGAGAGVRYRGGGVGAAGR
ncbi:hypothetical protein JCM10213_000069 [Rhodosporidiobolus nylandii]